MKIFSINKNNLLSNIIVLIFAIIMPVFFVNAADPITTIYNIKPTSASIKTEGLIPGASVRIAIRDSACSSENYTYFKYNNVEDTDNNGVVVIDWTGLPSPNTNYCAIIALLDKNDPTIFNQIEKIDFKTTNSSTTPPIIPDPTVPCKGPNDPPGCKPMAGGGSNTPSGGGSNTPSGGGANDGLKITSGIKNPLSDSFKDIPTFIKGVLRFFLLIGIPIVTLAIIYTGFLFVTAMGNSEKLKIAKKALIYTLIGAALLLGSLVITDAIQGSVEQIKSKNK